MTNNGDGDAPEPTLADAAISGFILFHLVALICWGLPINSRLVTNFRDATGAYMRNIGLAQTWPMFAPDPIMINAYLEAEITYQDGAMTVWKFPITSDYGSFERYSKERYRRWAEDILRDDANAPLWPDAARFVARIHDNPRNPPVRVTLIRYWAQMPPLPPPGRPPVTTPWHRDAIFTYTVQPADLSGAAP